MQQLNLVLVFERYEMSTYFSEFDYWVFIDWIVKISEMWERERERGGGGGGEEKNWQREEEGGGGGGGAR